MGKLFNELKRRNVVRVAIAYGVLGWVSLQAADILFSTFGAPEWVAKSFAALLLLGFPFACLFAWAFEMTPEGVMKTEEVDRSDSITHSTGRKLDYIIIAALVIGVAYLLFERRSEPEMATVESEDAVAVVESVEEPAESQKSIAVLPFVNMSSDKEHEWFADGLTEEILNSLARTPDLLVASRTSSFQYKGKTDDISEIAAALGVAHVLEGSVRRGRDKLRVTAQLIRASDGFHLWSETFDRSPDDVIQIQEDVAFEIANALETAMDPVALKKMVSAGTASVTAYEAYLEGLALEGVTGITGNIVPWLEALAAFEKAIELDPTFALPYWHASIFWDTQLGITDIGADLSDLSTAEKKQKYLAAVDGAIKYTDDPVEVLNFESNKALVEMRYLDALRYAESYVEALPNDFEALANVFSILATIGDSDRGNEYLSNLDDAGQVDPFVSNGLILSLTVLGNGEEAVRFANESLELFSDYNFIRYQAHRALLWNGKIEEGKKLAGLLRVSEFPAENIELLLLRQTCAENDNEQGRVHFDNLVFGEDPKFSQLFIAYQIAGRPDMAHQVLLDADLDMHALRGFLIYPYFNHTLFPELAKVLARQAIDRPYVSGPPYQCEFAESAFTVI